MAVVIGAILQKYMIGWLIDWLGPAATSWCWKISNIITNHILGQTRDSKHAAVLRLTNGWSLWLPLSEFDRGRDNLHPVWSLSSWTNCNAILMGCTKFFQDYPALHYRAFSTHHGSCLLTLIKWCVQKMIKITNLNRWFWNSCLNNSVPLLLICVVS